MANTSTTIFLDLGAEFYNTKDVIRYGLVSLIKCHAVAECMI